MTRKLLLALLLLSTVSVHGQFESDHTVIIEPCMGIPNAGRLYLGMTRLIAEYDEQIVSGPPIQYGGRMEYLITKAMGVAVEANYEKSGITNYTTYYSPSLGGYQDTSYSYQITKLRVLVRWMYHFGNLEKVDWYTGAGIGYSHETVTNGQNAPSIIDYNFAFFPKFFDEVSTPLAARINIGARFMFSPSIGMVTEFGLGSGSVLQIGLSVRL